MVKIEPFAIEKWMDEYETIAKYNLAETCSASVSVDELKALSADKSSEPLTLSKRLDYGSIRGSEKLRSNLANLYSAKTPTRLPAENILITPGAIMANFLLLFSMVGPGDHVICVYPTYQQLYSVPESIGAEVSLWRSKEQDNWSLDLDELRSLIKLNTKLIIINNPQNPTGAIITRSKLEDIIAIAKQHSLTIFSDEVYRPLFHSIGPVDPDFPPSILSLGYDNVIATGSLSKAYSLAGIRIGWIASRSREIIEACASSRDYTTISVSQLDDQVASFALDPSCVHSLLRRNIDLAKRNLDALEAFIDKHRWACDWVRPVAGTTAFVRFSKMGKPVDDEVFCKMLLEKTGAMLSPGSKCFGNGVDFKGYVRFGFVPHAEVLDGGLEALKGFLENGYEDVPLAAAAA